MASNVKNIGFHWKRTQQTWEYIKTLGLNPSELLKYKFENPQSQVVPHEKQIIDELNTELETKDPVPLWKRAAPDYISRVSSF